MYANYWKIDIRPSQSVCAIIRGSKESRQGSSRAIQCDYQERGENEIMSQKDEEKKKKKKQSILEKEIFSIMEKSMKTALDTSHEIPPLEYLIFR